MIEKIGECFLEYVFTTISDVMGKNSFMKEYNISFSIVQGQEISKSKRSASELTVKKILLRLTVRKNLW